MHTKAVVDLPPIFWGPAFNLFWYDWKELVLFHYLGERYF